METTDLFSNSVLPQLSLKHKAAEQPTTPTTKKCTRCGREKTLDHYQNNAASKDGLQSWCRECIRTYDKLNIKYRDQGGVKMCSRCKFIRPRTEFADDSHYKDGKSRICKNCEEAIKNHDAHSDASKAVHYRPLAAASLATYTDRQLFDEIKSRGYTGTLTKVQTLKIEI
jgi:NMD protein affecting ribosome stability and mRNA decay